MKNTQPPITLEEAIYLRKKLEEIYFPNDDKKVVYDSKEVKQFLDIINSERVGIPKGTSPKQIGIKLEEWYELLKQQQETITEVPRPTGPDATTLTSDQIANFEKDIERQKKSEQIRADQSKVVSRTQDRLKEIYDQQRIIQEQIKKTQELQPQFVDKKVYATVEQQEFIASLEAQKSFETLTEYANYQETRTDLIEQLTESVQSKTNTEEIVARTIAVHLTTDISSPELAKEKIREIAIEEAIEQSGDKVLEQVLQKEKVLIETAKKGAVLEAENMKGSVFLTREIAENILPLEIVEQIYGPKQIKVILSSEPSEQTTHEVDLEKSIRNYETNLKERSKLLENLREGGVDGAKSVFRSQLYSNVNTYLAKAPKGSTLGKVYSSDAVKAILTQGSPNALELKYFGKNPLLQTYFKYSPESMPYFKLFTEVTGVSVGVGVTSKIIPLTYGGGAIPLTKIAFIQPVKSLGVPYTLGVKTGAKFAVGKAAGQAAGQVAAKTGLSAAIASLGIPIPGANIIIGAIVWVGSELASKAKVLWQKHKEKIKPILAGLVTLGAIRFLGVGPGLGVGAVTTFGLMGTAGLSAIAFGGARLLGLIGRSTLITISTPVIVTLLVLPPLVAFIMLVINNSAYVVPPAPPSQSRSSNPYISVIKTAEPAGPFENSDLPLDITYTITISAKRDTLTNISFKDTCKIIQEASNAPCENSSYDVPDSISPSSPYVITYTNNYNKFTTDALVVNTFEVTATAGEAGEQTTSGAASIRIGNPPNQCFNIIRDGFNADQYSYVLGAISKLQDEFNGYASKICASLEGGSVDIKYAGSDPNFWGWWEGGYIRLYSKGVESSRNANYIIFHELAHVLATNDDSWFNQYKSYPGITNEPYPYCFYDYPDQTGSWPYSERFAEAASFYANDPCGNFRQRNPAHYKFMNDVLFK